MENLSNINSSKIRNLADKLGKDLDAEFEENARQLELQQAEARAKLAKV